MHATEMRRCRVCQQEKPITDFKSCTGRHQSGSNRRHTCMACFNAYMQQWKAAKRASERTPAQIEAAALAAELAAQGLKRCRDCGEAKPESEFYLHKHGKEPASRETQCKACYNAELRRGRRENPKPKAPKLSEQEKAAIQDCVQRCSNCGQEKRGSEFYVNIRNRCLTGHCKDCMKQQQREKYAEEPEVKNEMNKQWYEKNREKRIEQTGEYGKTHPELRRQIAAAYRERNPGCWKKRRHRIRAAVAAGGTFTMAEWRNLLDDCGHRCLRCGRSEADLQSQPPTKRVLEIDHIVPISHGGLNVIGNLQPLCTNCNSWKKAQTIDYRPEHIKLKYSGPQVAG